LGVTLAGSRHPLSDALLELARAERSVPIASLLGRKAKTSPLRAAFVNAATGHVLEFDDIKTGIGHPSVAVLPAVLAQAEACGAGGKAVLTAFILGFEVSCRIAAGVEPELSMNGWHTTSAVGIFGAAAGAAKLMGLAPHQIRNALGIAASFSGGLVRNFGTGIKPVHAGQAAEQGLKAAMLAQTGITADQNVLSGKWGFGDVFAGKCNDGERIVQNLGDSFAVSADGFKFYPCCASAHTAIDAVLALKKERPIDPEAIEKIEVGTVPVNIDNLKYPLPADPIQARFSMPFCVAAALLRGGVFLEDFEQARIDDPAVRRLMPKVTMYLHPDFAHLGYVGTENAVVTIHLHGGERLEKRVDIPRGHPLNPLTEEEMVAKYARCAVKAIAEGAVSRSAEMILRLETLDRLDELMALLGGGN
jgi:2-methylcitrate dehydratase PrpD